MTRTKKMKMKIQMKTTRRKRRKRAAHALPESSSWSLVARTASGALHRTRTRPLAPRYRRRLKLPIRTRMLWNDTPLPRISTLSSQGR